MLEDCKDRHEAVDRTVSFARFGCRLPQRISHSRWLVWALSVIALCTVVTTLTAVFMPRVRSVLLREDGILEMGSVVCLAGIVLWAGSAALVWGPRPLLVLGGLLGLAELMDETSFGARIFGFQPPALYGGGELDGFHDLLILFYRLLADVSPGLGWALVGLVLAASLGAILFVLKLATNMSWGAGSWLSNHALILLHVGLIGLAQFVDVTTSSRTSLAVEEVLEFNAAVVLLFYVAQQTLEARAMRHGEITNAVLYRMAQPE